MDLTWGDPIMQLAAAIVAILTLTMWGAIITPKIEAHRIKQLLVGVKAPPLLVGFVRRGITALVGLLVWRFGSLVGFEEFQDKAAAASVALAVVEFVWTIVDQLMKSDQNDKDPPPVAGGAPSEMGS